MRGLFIYSLFDLSVLEFSKITELLKTSVFGLISEKEPIRYLAPVQSQLFKVAKQHNTVSLDRN